MIRKLESQRPKARPRRNILEKLASRLTARVFKVAMILIFRWSPLPADFTNDRGAFLVLSLQCSRLCTQGVLCAPRKAMGGPAGDFGWLGVFLLAYLVVMFGLMPLLLIP
jgi:hypothetical protein